jgi:hypothetical protein
VEVIWKNGEFILERDYYEVPFPAIKAIFSSSFRVFSRSFWDFVGKFS